MGEVVDGVEKALVVFLGVKVVAVSVMLVEIVV